MPTPSLKLSDSSLTLASSTENIPAAVPPSCTCAITFATDVRIHEYEYTEDEIIERKKLMHKILQSRPLNTAAWHIEKKELAEQERDEKRIQAIQSYPFIPPPSLVLSIFTASSTGTTHNVESPSDERLLPSWLQTKRQHNKQGQDPLLPFANSSDSEEEDREVVQIPHYLLPSARTS
jgi:hypothetical protein